MRGLLGWLVVLGCGAVPEPQAPEEAAAAWSAAQLTELSRMRAVRTLPADPTNRVADNPAAAALGRALFYDPGLSGSGRFSCASCHDPAKHFTDALPLAVAAGTADRHTPSIEGSQLGPWFFWDGRADSLWAQAAGPVENPAEMDGDRLSAARHVLAAYPTAYVALFGAAPDLMAERFPARARPGDGPLGEAWTALTAEDQDAVTGVFVNAMKAIAAFERTALPGDAAFDHYVDALLAGDASGGGHLSDDAVAGLRRFVGDAGCSLCHHGPMLSDRAFHNLGTPEPRGFDPGRAVGARTVLTSPFNCAGRWSDAPEGSCQELRFLNPAFDDFPSAFKTPSLRNVTLTAPYMHHGGFADLDSVLTFYSELPGKPVVGHRELTLQPLHLDEAARRELVAFLSSLEAPVVTAALAPEAAAPAATTLPPR